MIKDVTNESLREMALVVFLKTHLTVFFFHDFYFLSMIKSKHTRTLPVLSFKVLAH